MSKFSLLLSKIVTAALGQAELLIYISKTKNSHLPNGQEGHRNSKLTDIIVRCTVNAQSLLSQNESDHICIVAQFLLSQNLVRVLWLGAWSCDLPF